MAVRPLTAFLLLALLDSLMLAAALVIEFFRGSG
jgi:hypothetical protein